MQCSAICSAGQALSDTPGAGRRRAEAHPAAALVQPAPDCTLVECHARQLSVIGKEHRASLTRQTSAPATRTRTTANAMCRAWQTRASLATAAMSCQKTCACRELGMHAHQGTVLAKQQKNEADRSSYEYPTISPHLSPPSHINTVSFARSAGSLAVQHQLFWLQTLQHPRAATAETRQRRGHLAFEDVYLAPEAGEPTANKRIACARLPVVLSFRGEVG